MSEINDIEKQIATLTTRLDKLKRQELSWPKTVQVYVHTNKEDNYDVLQEAEVSEDFIKLHSLQHMASEVKLTMVIDRDGKVMLTHVDDHALVIPAPQ